MQEQAVCTCGHDSFYVWLDHKSNEVYLLCSICDEPIVISSHSPGNW